MAEVVAPVIDQVVGSLMAVIKKELGYWWNSRKNVEDMQGRLEQLNETAEETRNRKEANAAKNLVVPRPVSPWLEKVKKINEEAAGIPTGGIGIGCFNIKMRYKAGKQSSSILEKIRGLKENKSEIVWTDEEIPLARVPFRNAATTSSPVEDFTQTSFGSRDLIFKEALKSLKANSTHMIALCGMGGVGKSHMMERLKKEVEDSDMFYWVVKVVVGQNTDPIALQHAVAEKTGRALTKTTRDARAELLKKRFLETSQGGEKKILVILDDVWKVFDLEEIGLPSPLPYGFKLLITSRDANVCTQMGVNTDSVFRIGALNDVEAQTLFFETVGLSKGDDPDLYKIGENIIRRCGNLPIALKTIASTLRGQIKNEFEWEEALCHLKQHDFRDHYEIVHQVFKVSYDSLKKDEKAIFLLSGLFPDDSHIPLEELIRYAYGLKLLSKVNTIANARHQVKVCVNKLISANLLAESDNVGCVLMHDLARAFALDNSIGIKQASIVNSDDISEQLTEDISMSYERILFNCMGLLEFPKYFNCPNLTFLKLMGGDEQLKFSKGFYESMEKLEVLSYEEMSCPPLLSGSIQCSIHLRILSLHGCELINDWSAIGDLVHLEVLSFANSHIEKLPHVIGKLKNLRLLDLSGCLDLCIDEGVFRCLEKLEELYMRVSGNKAIRFTKSNYDELEELSMKLSALEVEFFDNKTRAKNMSYKNLERFRISIGCLLKEDKELYSFQNTLKLVTNKNDLLDCKINELFKKTEKLHLEVKDMKHLIDVSIHPPQDSFSKLRILRVYKCRSLRHLFTVSMTTGLRKLEQLIVEDCPILESLVHCDESDNNGVIKFQKLKFLALILLPKLGSLCDSDKVVELPQLMELELTALPNFTSIDHPNQAMQPLFNNQIKIGSIHPPQDSFSKLRVLEIFNCKGLRYLFTVAMSNGLRELERLKVDICDLESLVHGDESENDGVIIFQELKFLYLYNLPKLRGLCDIDIVVELPQLKELILGNLPNFTSIYPRSAMHPFFNKQVVIPKLEKMNISSMKNLKQIWQSEVSVVEEVHISKVREIKVKFCENLVNLFPYNPMPLLRNLEDLHVECCNSIEVLFNIDLGCVGKTEEVSSSLRSIHVKGSSNLTEVWRIKGAHNSQVGGFQKVENIHIHGCRRFKYVFTPVTTNFDMSAHLDTDIQDSSDYILNKMLRSLHPNKKATKIALYGIGNMGKTRKMEYLIKAVEDWRKFDLVVRLVIGRESNIIDLQQATAKYINEALTETNIEARADSLRKRFAQMQQEGKRNILVILDDIWKVLDLKDIGISVSPLPNGFRLLILSRYEDVCIQMGFEKSSIIRLGIVDDVEARTLFFKTAELSKDDDPDLFKIGEEIIMICGNFPISLKAIASALKANIKDKSKWENALSQLQHHNLENINDVMKIAFMMSYNNLKEDEKAMLFLCGLFPKYFDIHVEELMRYAWGLKLFHKVYATNTLAARHRMKASVDGLIHANILTQGFLTGWVTMQQHAHDFVLCKFTEVKQASFDHGNQLEDADESCERIFLNCKGTSTFHVDFNYPNLKLLKLKGDTGKLVKFPQDFYDRMEKLEVVAYEMMVNPLLPSYSINLRTLCLYSCSLNDDFSFLGSLINLEILRFAFSDIQQLPSTIGKLKRLKVLDVTRCKSDLCIEDGIFQNLIDLEELYMTSDSRSHIRFTDANYEELELLSRQLHALTIDFYENKFHPKDGCFEKLEKFRISMGCKLTGPTDMQYYSENQLMLKTNCIELVECKSINELFERTEILYLEVEYMKNLEDVSMNYSFCNLKKLHVSNCADLNFLFRVEVASGLRKLEQLDVVSCPVLETLIHGESKEGGRAIVFPKLKSLSLEFLPRLMSLCETENRVELHQLEWLTFRHLPNISSIYPDDSMHPKAFFNKQVQIPNLKTLWISDMEKLMQIWPCEITAIGSEEEAVNNNHISMLRDAKVVRCESLVNLFPCNPLPLLNHLEVLEVESCWSIEVLFNMDLRGAGAANINELTSSLRSIEVHGLGNLRELWRIKGGNRNNSSSGLVIACFQAVDKIDIKNCPRFRDIFAPKSINFDIRAHVTIKEDD